MNVLSLFSGIGGLDIAAGWAGMKTVAFCEIESYPVQVLEKRWPGVPIYRDVRDLTAERLRQDGVPPIDLIAGGFPCQPHSLAGKRLASNDERDLWGECARLLCETGAEWGVFKNVPGLLSSEAGRFFGRVLRDLAKIGYDAGWWTYPAAAVGSPQERFRVFLVAHGQCMRQS